MTIFKGRKYGMIHTIDITTDHIRAVFFPKDFYEKYKYLGAIPYSDGGISKVIRPLVLLMDMEAKPWWCPRWVLRFLYLFGSDNSIVRVRNHFLNDIFRRLTKGIIFWDWKTKWSDYDLRISISAPEYIQNLSDMIESEVYRDGRKLELKNRLKELNIEFSEYDSLFMLEQKYEQAMEEKK